MYGTNSSHNSGDTTYTLSDYSWGYQSIWDAGGTDTISHAGQSTNAVINLTAATLTTNASLDQPAGTDGAPTAGAA